MKIVSIPSEIPGWYDPEVSGFEPPASWTDCRIRIKVPVSYDAPAELQRAKEAALLQYPGAILEVVPEFSKSVKEGPAVAGSDKALLQSFLSQEGIEIPPGFSVDQVVAYILHFLPHISSFGINGLEFLEVEGENVLSFEKVKWDLQTKGLTVISGRNEDWNFTESNGAGKSSLVTLPFLLIFGRTFKGQRDDEWAREDTLEPAILKGSLKLQDGRVLKIQRCRRPQSLQIWVDGEDKTMGRPSATQEAIESWTNFTWEVATNCVYVGQREIGSVFGTDKDRKELFSRLVGVERFLDAQAKIRKKANQYRDLITEFEMELRGASAGKEQAAADIAEIQSSLTCEKLVSDELVKEVEASSETLKIQANEARAFVKRQEPWLEKNQKAFEEILSKEIEADTRRDILREEIAKLDQVAGKSTCPICQQRVSVHHIEEHQTRLEKDLKAAKQKGDYYSDLQTKNREIRKQVLTRVQNQNLVAERSDKERAKIESQLASLRASVDARKRLEGLLERSKARLAKLVKSVSIFEQVVKSLQSEKSFVTFCAEVVGRDGLPVFLCETLIAPLNIAGQRYSEIFTEGEVAFEFYMEGDSIDVDIKNAHGSKTLKGQSEGELRMASIMTVLSFCDVLVPINFLVLDEPSQGLDGANAEAFARGLTAVAERFGHLVVISHHERLLNELKPDQTIEIVKKNKVSRIISV